MKPNGAWGRSPGRRRRFRRPDISQRLRPGARSANGGGLMSTPKQRRTFAIISHPDAGKTTLTEKLLLFGGAIHMAGEVRARGQNRRARSDWMKIEQARGISVTSSVMTFERGDTVFNLLDTPGHEDFSEDTYRTLTAVDSAVMVIDAARGIEAQTRKLFEVCRLRDVPILTFINKVDREGRDPFELFDEIADVLALDVAPLNWPAGMGGEFKGLYDLRTHKFLKPDGTATGAAGETVQTTGLDDPKIEELCGPIDRTAARAGRTGAGRLCDARRAALPPGRADSGAVRLGAQGFRRRGADRRARRIRPRAPPAAGDSRSREADRPARCRASSSRCRPT